MPLGTGLWGVMKREESDMTLKEEEEEEEGDHFNDSVYCSMWSSLVSAIQPTGLN